MVRKVVHCFAFSGILHILKLLLKRKEEENNKAS